MSKRYRLPDDYRRRVYEERERLKKIEKIKRQKTNSLGRKKLLPTDYEFEIYKEFFKDERVAYIFWSYGIPVWQVKNSHKHLIPFEEIIEKTQHYRLYSIRKSLKSTYNI